MSDQAADLLAEYAASSPALIHEATDSTLSSAPPPLACRMGAKALPAIGTGNGPWHGYDQAAVSLTAAIKALARTAWRLAAGPMRRFDHTATARSQTDQDRPICAAGLG